MQADTKISIVIPVLNQLEYTRGCLESLSPDIAAGVEVVVIDNGSDAATRDFLTSQKQIVLIRNNANRGCASAWNQGVKSATGEWIVVLNNDVRVASGWLQGLLDFARETGAGVVTPAIREGVLNYEFDSYAKDYVVRMRDAKRMGSANGVCFMVQRKVFQRVGLFDENFRIGQFEDADFFLRCRAANVLLATTGRAFLHHFGSITQNDIRDHAKPGPYEAENRAYFRKKWNLTAPKRFVQRIGRQMRNARWRNAERSKYGHSLYEKWIDGRLQYF